MFALPLTGTKTREIMGDLAHVVEVLHPNNRAKLRPFGEALRNARKFMETYGKEVARANFICYGNCNVPKYHGCIVLVSVGRRGGFRVEWNFGKADGSGPAR